MVMGPVEVVTQIAQGVGVLASVWALKQLMDHDATMAGRGGGAIPRCPRCNGSRLESCLCNRWSDKDVGCRTCNGSGRMTCSSCGGSGRGRPMPVQLHATTRQNLPTAAGPKARSR